MKLKKITTKEGEIYFVNAKTGERVVTKMDVTKTTSQPDNSPFDFNSLGNSDETEGIQTNEKKQRHGCLTAWLVLMIIGNSVSMLMYLFGSELIKKSFPDAPSWSMPVLVIMGIANVIFAVALFKWRMWGFVGSVGSSIIVFFINLSIGVGILQSIGGILGVAILYGVLKMGNERAAWPKLE